MNKYFFISLLCMLLLSCNKQNSKTEQKILQVELSPKDLAASTLFKKIEVIPLETNEQCLLKTIGRVIEAGRFTRSSLLFLPTVSKQKLLLHSPEYLEHR